jgi:hypothetical protein
MADQGRHARVALNESRFRDINDRVRQELAQLRTPPQRLRLVCECASLDCREQVELSLAEYERVRADPLRFVIVPGHEIPEAEDVAERGEGFTVVRKHADAAPLARSTDPRRP